MITLVILILQLPKYNVEQVLLSFSIVMGTTSSGGLQTIGINTQMVMVALLLAASGFRYYTALESDETKKNLCRYCSVVFFISCVYFEILALLAGGLANTLSKINPYFIFSVPLIFTAIALVIGYGIERKWVEFYGYKYKQGMIASVFILFTWALLGGTYAAELFPWLYSTSWKSFLTLFSLVFLGFLLLVYVVYIIVGHRRKLRNKQNTDQIKKLTRTHQEKHRSKRPTRIEQP